MDGDKPNVVFQPSQGVVGVATDAIDALRTSPTLLVMVLLNCVFLAVAGWYLRGQQTNAFALVDKMLEHCLAAKPPELKP
jgi:hypothetical protein